MIGEMKDRVTVYKLDKVENGRGGKSFQEILIGEFWASIEALSDNNVVQYRQADMNTNTEIIMRKHSAISRECVIYSKGSKYRIDEVLEKDGILTIMAVGEKIA